jgi:hypothetical protein
LKSDDRYRVGRDGTTVGLALVGGVLLGVVTATGVSVLAG